RLFPEFHRKERAGGAPPARQDFQGGLLALRRWCYCNRLGLAATSGLVTFDGQFVPTLQISQADCFPTLCDFGGCGDHKVEFGARLVLDDNIILGGINRCYLARSYLWRRLRALRLLRILRFLLTNCYPNYCKAQDSTNN